MYESYGLTQQERRIVEDFLARYSSTSNTVAEEQAQQEDEG